MDKIKFELRPVKEKPSFRQNRLELNIVEAKKEVRETRYEPMSSGEKRFIESAGFPVQSVNDASVKEKEGGGRPPYWEMVFWWTRKPLFSARAVIAGSLLPEMPDPSRFLYYLGARRKGGGFERVPHSVNPTIPSSWRQYFEGKTLLDPFACFGSIPLEGMRLGLSKVVAVDFLPVAYIFLKAVLEYPAKYGSPLIEDVERWGKWVTERLKEDPDIKEMYESDVAVYIGTWEVKCPLCEGYTPLVGNWWLSRVKDKEGGWKALAWMKAKPESGQVNIETVDLGELHGSSNLRKVVVEEYERRLGKSKLSTYVIKAGDGEWKIEEPNIATGVSYAKCLICGNPIIADEEAILKLTDSVSSLFKELNIPVSPSRSLILALLQKGAKKSLNDFLTSNPDFEQFIRRRKGQVEGVLGELVEREVEEKWYVKQTLKEWNMKLDEYLEGRIGIEELRQSRARPCILAKLRLEERLRLEQTIEEDNMRFWRALEKLRQIWGDPDIPIERFCPYGASGGGCLSIPIWGFNKFYKLFNPCQLLNMLKLVKLIREVGNKIQEEKEKEGMDEEEAFRYAKVVITYLAIALSRYADHNNIATRLHPSNPMGIEIANSLSMRGLSMQWNWGDTNILTVARGILRTNSWIKCLEKEIDGLSYLISTINKNGSRVEVLLDNASSLSQINANEKFGLIVTDPPYRDDVPYAELSDFYFIWLKRALSDVGDRGLTSKFNAESFFKDGREITTQWEEYRLKEISLNPYRLGESVKLEDGIFHYRSLMAQAFLTMYERLRDDGVVVTYFAHTDPEAWAELIEAGWRFAGFIVTNAFPMATESATSVVKRGKLSLDTSVAVIWRKPVEAKPASDIREIRGHMLREGIDWAGNVLGKYYGRDLFFTTFAKILSIATKYNRLTDMMGELDAARLVKEYVTPLTGKALVSAISGGLTEDAAIADPIAQFYLLIKILFAIRDSGNKVPKRKIVDKNDIVLLTLATGINKDEPSEWKLIEKSPTRSGEYTLLEPLTDKPEDLEKLLRRRGIDTIRLEVVDRSTSPVDLLHMMGYAAVSRGNPQRAFDELRAKYPSQYSTAIALAKALIGALPEGDEEKGLCRSLLLYLGG